MQKFDAFILAGGQTPWLKDFCNTEYRCLVPINNKRLIDYIITALQDSGSIRRIVIAASEGAAKKLEGTLPDDVKVCLAAEDLPLTAVNAVKALGTDSTEKLLGVCDDIPLITGKEVHDFLRECAKYPEKELFYPIIPKQICLKQFPEAKRTYATLSDGTFTGGNMMFMHKNIISIGQEKAKELFKLRKSPLKLANWLGWSFICKAIFHCLSIKNAEERFSKLMQIDSKAIITNSSSIGMDVDKPADLQLVNKYLCK